MPDTTSSSPGPGTSKGTIEAIVTGIERVLLSLPIYLRAVTLIGVLAIIAVAVSFYFKSRDNNGPGTAPPSVAVQNTLPQYTNGTPDPNHHGADNNNIQNLEANHKSEEDNAAFSYHLSGGNTSLPEEQTIKFLDNDNYLKYRYFESDKCLYVNRRETGINHYQWLKDPAYHQHDIDKKISAGKAPENPASLSVATHPVSRILSDSVLATEVPNLPAGAAASPQVNCANPHPGAFKYWWGQPLDQCNSPMYRQFADGCTHYQFYNRCSNSWDGRIFWTVCHPPPHH
jgi:hypothetical protein